MPKALKIFLIAIASLVALVVGGGFLLPSEYAAERSIEIEAEPQAVFDMVADLEVNQQWSPWKFNDPSIDVTYGDKKVGEGASYSWTSENSGVGTLKIAKADPPNSITNDLDFDGQLATATWTFEKTDKGTKVTWGISGDNGMNPIGRWFGLMLDSMVGPDFELGLSRLKEHAEKA